MGPQDVRVKRAKGEGAASSAQSREESHVLTLEEISNLARSDSNPAETLMNVVALIAKRFGTEVCSIYLLEPDRANLVLAATVGLRPKVYWNAAAWSA